MHPRVNAAVERSRWGLWSARQGAEHPRPGRHRRDNVDERQHGEGQMMCADVESGREDDGERFGADQRHAETERRHVEEENGIPFCGKAEPFDGVERHHRVCNLHGGEQREDPHRARARVRQRQRQGLRQHAAGRGKDGACERANDPGVVAGKVCTTADKGRGDAIGATGQHLSAISRRCRSDRLHVFRDEHANRATRGVLIAAAQVRFRSSRRRLRRRGSIGGK